MYRKDIDLTGRKFGRLTVIGESPNRIGRHVSWKCKCDCGNMKDVITYFLLNGSVVSCGCKSRETLSEIRTANLAGKRFDRLTVLNQNGTRDKDGNVMWCCKCDCGNIITVSSIYLKTRKHCSCGCHKLDRIKIRRVSKPVRRIPVVVKKNVHEHMPDPDRERLIRIYNGMYKRCYNESDSSYVNYGNRGIYICDEWLNDRESFITWALSNGYRSDLSLDRINAGVYMKDQNGPYAPWNCRWATRFEQANNRRTSKTITVDGITHTVVEWTDVAGISNQKFYGIPSEDASIKFNDYMSKNPSICGVSRMDVCARLFEVRKEMKNIDDPFLIKAYGIRGAKYWA